MGEASGSRSLHDMRALTKNKGIVGLDLEAASVAATEVHLNGSPRVVGAGILKLPPGVVREGEVTDGDALAAALKQLFAENRLAKTVRLGIANQRVVVRTLRFPVIEKASELETAIRFQAQDQIPMPLEQAVLEHQVIGRSTSETGEATMDVVVVAARRDTITPLVGAMRKAGLKPIGIDVSAFGMIRALAGEAGVTEPGVAHSYEERMANPEVQEPAALYCNLGDVTNLAVAQGSTCLFTRVSQFGMAGIGQRLAERCGLTLEHATQWLAHVGLVNPLEHIDGDPEIVSAAREALGEGASKLVDELRLSLEYYGAQEGALTVESVVACGTGTTIPGIVERIERELGLRIVAPNVEALAHLDPAAAARLILPYGLAIEG